jgi:hypothetical protein
MCQHHMQISMLLLVPLQFTRSHEQDSKGCVAFFRLRFDVMLSVGLFIKGKTNRKSKFHHFHKNSCLRNCDAERFSGALRGDILPGIQVLYKLGFEIKKLRALSFEVGSIFPKTFSHISIRNHKFVSKITFKFSQKSTKLIKLNFSNSNF